jgi:hypothetical protein
MFAGLARRAATTTIWHGVYGAKIARYGACWNVDVW